jgi:ATP-dependent DNA helicase RecG
MKKEKLIGLIDSGEGLQIEFKERIPPPDELASEIVAFANTDGGTIIFGVSDKGEIVGLQFEGNLEEYIMFGAYSHPFESKNNTGGDKFRQI